MSENNFLKEIIKEKDELQNSNIKNEENKQFTQEKKVKSEQDLNEVVNDAKKEAVKSLSSLLHSKFVRAWFILFFYFILICFIWIASYSICDILYHETPKKLLINIWKNAFSFIQLVFTIIGIIVVVFKLLIRGRL